MRYLIDGYNLLFRIIDDSSGDLQKKREALIIDLNSTIALSQVDVTIIFDGTSFPGDRTKTHYDHLEILYSAKGETADEFILDFLSDCKNPQNITVVTSDKTLALHARNRTAYTETVESFLHRNHKKQKKKEKTIQENKKTFRLASKQKPSDTNKVVLEGNSDYYFEVFEKKWKEIEKEENTKKALKKAARKSKTARKNSSPQKQKDRMMDPEKEIERWRHFFEKPGEEKS